MTITTYENTTHYIAADKGQDFVVRGKLSNGSLWYAVFDGHGTDQVIDELRKVDFNTVMETKNPAKVIEDIVSNLGDTFRSGATMSIVIISPTTISCYWRGDSTIMVWGDNAEVFTSENHNSTSTSEMDRITSIGKEIIYAWAPKIIDKYTMTMVKSPYFVLDSRENNLDPSKPLRDMLNMTNSLGHNNNTQGAISEHHINLIPGVNYCMIAASDGLWDIVAPQDNLLMFRNACDIVDFAHHRWKQQWTYVYPGYEPKITKLPRVDDIGVAMWRGTIGVED